MFIFSFLSALSFPNDVARAQSNYPGRGIFYITGCGNIDDPQKTELQCVVTHTISIALKFVGAIIVVMIIISGIMYITSMGNPDRVGLAKKTLVGSIIGLIIVVMSYFIVDVAANLFQK